MADISIDRRYWVEDSVARAWPPGRDVFTGEDNPKANYALDLNIDGKVMTFIPSSVINNGVYNPFGEVSKGRIYADKSYYMPWFLDPNNQKTLAETGSKVDLADSSVGKYLKDKMGASTDGVLVPKGSIPFDSQIVNAPGKVQGIGNINGQNVYVNEDVNKQGRTFFTDPAGQTREYIAPSGGGGFLGGLLGGIGDIGEDIVGGIKDFGGNIDQAVRETLPGGWTTAALLAAGYYGPEAAGAGGLTGTDAALADLAASTPAFTGTTAGATGAAATGGLMTGGSTGTGFQATGTTGLTGAGTTAYGGLGAGLGEATAAGGIGGSAIGGLGLTGGEAAFGGLGANLGTAGLAAGTGSLLGTGAAAGGVAAGLTAAEAAKAGLISGGLNTVGGLLQGETSKDAANQLAAQQAALAEKTLQMGKFQPVGVTTRFGTSAFTTDPVTGAITPSYTLSPEAKAYQDALSGMATQGLTAGQGLMNLGQQYVGESPEAVRNRYLSTQRALLAPQQEQTLAALRNRQAATGRGGLAFGATSDGMMATNPEIAAYYNSLAQTERQLAANAETQYQNQVNFGTGLLGQATTPFTNVFGAQKGVELAAQQPLELSTNFANLAATRGAAQGANYATAMAPSLQAQYNANNYNPLATTLQGAASNPLTGYGLMKLTGLA